jgi:hypothetical protein
VARLAADGDEALVDEGRVAGETALVLAAALREAVEGAGVGIGAPRLVGRGVAGLAGLRTYRGRGCRTPGEGGGGGEEEGGEAWVQDRVNIRVRRSSIYCTPPVPI